MQEQQELWASPARPRKLVLTLERRWDLGDDVIEWSASAMPSKGERGSWYVGYATSEADADVVLPYLLEMVAQQWLGAGWATEPRRTEYEFLRHHLLDF